MRDDVATERDCLRRRAACQSVARWVGGGLFILSCSIGGWMYSIGCNVNAQSYSLQELQRRDAEFSKQLQTQEQVLRADYDYKIGLIRADLAEIKDDVKQILQHQRNATEPTNLSGKQTTISHTWSNPLTEFLYEELENDSVWCSYNYSCNRVSN